MKAPDGRLWFPTMGGVAVIDPKAVRLNTNAPPVVIEEVRRGGETVEFAGGLEVPAGTSAVEIRYTAPSFVDPEQIAFRYRLDGLDDDWIDARDRRSAVYHRVPPGRYRFNVIAANNDGVWNMHGAASTSSCFRRSGGPGGSWRWRARRSGRSCHLPISVASRGCGGSTACSRRFHNS